MNKIVAKHDLWVYGITIQMLCCNYGVHSVITLHVYEIIPIIICIRNIS
jgi:hypothetical protein